MTTLNRVQFSASLLSTPLGEQWRRSLATYSNRENAIQSIRDHMKWSMKGHHFACDRFESLPLHWRVLSRKALKIYLNSIGEKLAEFKRNDDVDGALEWVNSDGRIFRNRFQSHEIFEQLFDECFFICNDCEVLEREDNHTTCYDDYWVCESCADNYRYSERRDTYISEQDYYDEEDEYDDDDDGRDEDCVIGSYHSSKRYLGHLPSSFDKHKKPIYLGLELEMEIHSDYDREEKAQQLIDAIGMAQLNGINHRYAMCEGDGSLEHGFEMVTGYTGLDTHAKQLQFFKSPFRGAKSHDTRTCGLHVHICKSDASLLHCAKMVLFINESSNQKLIRAIARRDGANYSKILNKKASYNWLKQSKGNNKASRIQQLNNDRYEALNFQNPNTIEFRIFKGTLKYESIMASLEFTYATWFFCKDTGTNDLTTEKFLDFICLPENRIHTRFLRQYLKEKNFALPKSGIVKINPRSEISTTQQLDSIEA